MIVYVLAVVWVDGDSYPHAAFLSVHSSRGGAEQAATEHHLQNPSKAHAYSHSQSPSDGRVEFVAIGEECSDLEDTEYVITEVELLP